MRGLALQVQQVAAAGAFSGMMFTPGMKLVVMLSDGAAKAWAARFAGAPLEPGRKTRSPYLKISFICVVACYGLNLSRLRKTG
jgi:hypothetical protein